jgi:hypothetical protein
MGGEATYVKLKGKTQRNMILQNAPRAVKMACGVKKIIIFFFFKNFFSIIKNFFKKGKSKKVNKNKIKKKIKKKN